MNKSKGRMKERPPFTPPRSRSFCTTLTAARACWAGCARVRRCLRRGWHPTCSPPGSRWPRPAVLPCAWPFRWQAGRCRFCLIRPLIWPVCAPGSPGCGRRWRVLRPKASRGPKPGASAAVPALPIWIRTGPRFCTCSACRTSCSTPAWLSRSCAVRGSGSARPISTGSTITPMASGSDPARLSSDVAPAGASGDKTEGKTGWVR